jgi:hypothetical protein
LLKLAILNDFLAAKILRIDGQSLLLPECETFVYNFSTLGHINIKLI